MPRGTNIFGRTQERVGNAPPGIFKHRKTKRRQLCKLKSKNQKSWEMDGPLLGPPGGAGTGIKTQKGSASGGGKPEHELRKRSRVQSKEPEIRIKITFIEKKKKDHWRFPPP